jgi:hypothetical protein
MKVEARAVRQIKIKKSEYVVLDHQALVGVDYSSKRFAQFCTIGCRLEHCRFDGSIIKAAQLGSGTEPSEFLDCSFDGARMTMGPGGYARYVHCSFRNVELRDWTCLTVELIDCMFSGRLCGGIFNGSVPEDDRARLRREKNEFHGNDFSNMDLVDVSFRTGIDLTQQRLPSGPDYLYLPKAEEALKYLWTDIVGWKDIDQRQSALSIFKAIQYEATMGQQQLLLREDNYQSHSRQVVKRVFMLLREGAGSL